MYAERKKCFAVRTGNPLVGVPGIAHGELSNTWLANRTRSEPSDRLAAGLAHAGGAAAAATMSRAPRVLPTRPTVCAHGSCGVGAPPAPTVVLSSLLPRGGPANGGTAVQLQGVGLTRLPRGRLAHCAFGNLTVPAIFTPGQLTATLSPSPLLHCASPIVPVAETVTVRISLDDGRTWIEGAVPYAYYDAPAVRALRPASGPTAGGTLVLVLGAGFGPYSSLGHAVAVCRFGSDASAPPGGGRVGAALQPSGWQSGDAPLRTHMPRFVTTPATILHQGALRCRAPIARGLGDAAVSIALNGRDFTRVGAAVGVYSYYDNWVRPHIGGVAPSVRGAHAAARMGNSLWLFGGFGDQRGPMGGWSDNRPSSIEREMRASGAMSTSTPEALHNDMHVLRTGVALRLYPTDEMPDLSWHPLNYSTRVQRVAGRVDALRGVSGTTLGVAMHSSGASNGGVGGGVDDGPARDASSAAGESDAFASFATDRSPSPRARSGHSLVGVGPRLVLFGGEANAHIEFPISETFAVQAEPFLHGQLTPRRRGQPGAFSPQKPMDPVQAAYKLSSDHLMANVDLLPPELSPRADIAQAAARAATDSWEVDPLWEATEAKLHYHMRGTAVLSHATHGSDVRPVRDDLDTVSTATHVRSNVYVQRLEQLDDVYVYNDPSRTWVLLRPTGERVPPRESHAACEVSPSTMAVFGGWRMVHPCGDSSTPCGEFLNDLHLLHLPPPPPMPFGEDRAPGWRQARASSAEGDAGDAAGDGGHDACCEASRWETPLVDGLPPVARSGHSLTKLFHWQGGSYGGGDMSDDEEALLLLFGQGWLWNATTQEGKALFFNDVHILHLGNLSWYPLRIAGAAPAPRSGHSATVAPDGRRVIIFGGQNARGALNDVHLLDLSEPRGPLWWQLQPSGRGPSPRHSHTATLFGSDLVIVGGHPPQVEMLDGGIRIEMLNLVHLEMQTSAAIAPLVRRDAALNESCSLVSGTEGSPVQQWTCGSRLRLRDVNQTIADQGDDYLFRG